MKSEGALPTTIDEYIAASPREAQARLKQVRAAIKKVAPDAEEAIRYRLATFVLGRNLVHFGAFKSHLGFYPGATGIAEFQEELAGYEWSKGAVQFPFDRPLPLGLIEKITAFRVGQERERMAGKKKAAPKTAAPKKAAPKTAAPKTAAPKKAAPKTAAPKKAVAKKAVAKVASKGRKG